MLSYSFAAFPNGTKYLSICNIFSLAKRAMSSTMAFQAVHRSILITSFLDEASLKIHWPADCHQWQAPSKTQYTQMNIQNRANRFFASQYKI